MRGHVRRKYKVTLQNRQWGSEVRTALYAIQRNHRIFAGAHVRRTPMFQTFTMRKNPTSVSPSAMSGFSRLPTPGSSNAPIRIPRTPKSIMNHIRHCAVVRTLATLMDHGDRLCSKISRPSNKMREMSVHSDVARNVRMATISNVGKSTICLLTFL